MMLSGLLFNAWNSPEIRSYCLNALCLWITLEVAFYLHMTLHVYPKLRAQRTPVPNIRGAKGTLDIIMKQMEIVDGFYSQERFLTSWFRGCRMEDIKYDNLIEHMAWSVFACEDMELSESQRQMLHEAVSEGFGTISPLTLLLALHHHHLWYTEKSKSHPLTHPLSLLDLVENNR